MDPDCLIPSRLRSSSDWNDLGRATIAADATAGSSVADRWLLALRRLARRRERGSEPGGGDKVTVTLNDTKLAISPTGLQAGQRDFIVVNNGKRAPRLEIAGPGPQEAVRTAKLAPGKSATVSSASGGRLHADALDPPGSA